MSQFFNAPPTTQELAADSSIPLDPTLDSCCQREAEATSARATALATVRGRDKIFARERLMERERRNVRCGCCFVERVEGEDYPALAGLRMLRALGEREAAVEEREREPTRPVSDSEGSDSDYDGLLDDVPASYSASLASRQAALASLAAHGFGSPLSLSPASLPSVVAPLLPGEHCPTVLHLYDPALPDCAHLDLELERLAPSHPGTRFFRADGTALFGSPFPAVAALLASLRLKARRDVPCLLVLRGGSLCNSSPSLRAFGSLAPPSLSPNMPSSPSLNLSAVGPWLDSSGGLSSAPAVDVGRLCEAASRFREEEQARREREREVAEGGEEVLA
ncbi:hypothetical protein TeGR_g2105, partial [Tetraparma gracilis]